MLISAANPCRCGYLTDPERACPRAPICGQDYLGRISGPLMDRFDLRVEVPPVTMQDLNGADTTHREGSADIAGRVLAARLIQAERYRDITDVALNTDAEGEVLEAVASPDRKGAEMLEKAADKFKLTARGYHRVLRVARTIADLDAQETVCKPHISEALSYRLAF